MNEPPFKTAYGISHENKGKPWACSFLIEINQTDVHSVLSQPPLAARSDAITVLVFFSPCNWQLFQLHAEQRGAKLAGSDPDILWQDEINFKETPQLPE